MNSKITMIIAIVLGLAVLGLGLVLEPQMPDQMAVHWGADGQVDGYGSHFIGIWLLPIIIIGLTLMMVLIPSIDPRKANIAKFRNEYNGFVLFFSFFLAYLQVLTLLWNLGKTFDLQTYLVPAFGGLVFYIGVLVAKAKSNYFIGIRTPWTLQDEQVWNDTHRLGGLLFKISGLIAFVGIVLPQFNIWLLVAPLLFTSVVTIVYSYFRYQKIHPTA
ncbi:MAG: hypothetical protein CL609_07805 [Anaerolineaceae bacterium]|nr:hypothetical protein [Anaerolineaceae bacterium]